MSFAFQSLLTFGLPLVALPLLIHLINLRRHRRVEWAAMDFLMESQKKNRKWIVLQQLLLLLLRTAAVAAVVLMLAGPVLLSQWGRFLGQGSTHHVFLLDDSYSMADQSREVSAFDLGKRAVQVVLDQVVQDAADHRVTLIRFSEAESLSAGAAPAINAKPINENTRSQIQAQLDQSVCSQTDASADLAIHAAIRLPKPSAEETRIVYLVSDFRSRHWTADELIKRRLRRLQSESAQLQLLHCVESERTNLAIVRLEPEAGIRSAGVETWFTLTVANHSDEPALGVSASILQDDHKLPSVVIDEIASQSEVTRRFRVSFPTAGAHRLQASLQTDAVATDNIRYFACTVPAEFPVLIVDGSPAGDDSFYLRTALRPGGAVGAGWNPRVEPVSFLRRHDQLALFAAICLLDVARLDESEVEALEQYVAAGGGLAIFLGSEVQRAFYNERLFRDGTGLLPAALDVPTQLLNDSLQNEPDLVISDHPLFRMFSGQRNSFLPLVSVDFYYALQADWRLPAEGQTRVLARLRNGAPFVLEKQFGEGTVVLQLAKLSPKRTDLGSWSNWSLNPVFPIYANELVGQLSARRRIAEDVKVGDRLAFELPETAYEPEFRVLPPQATKQPSKTFYPKAAEGVYQVDAGVGAISGVWGFELFPREGNDKERLLAVNVVPEEGDLDFLDRGQLAFQLRGIEYKFQHAANMTVENQQLGGFQLSDSLLLLLAIVLIVEQWLAYRASYHQQDGVAAK